MSCIAPQTGSKALANVAPIPILKLLLSLILCVSCVFSSPLNTRGFSAIGDKFRFGTAKGVSNTDSKIRGVDKPLSVLRGHLVPMHLKAVISGLAGGMAGASVGFLLHPLDTVKTMSQADQPSHAAQRVRHILIVFFAFLTLIKQAFSYPVSVIASIGYSVQGVLPSAAGSFFSSSIYFATYESMKSYWSEILPSQFSGFVPSMAAVSGNAVSSLVFVPKEVLKQRCQVGQLGAGQTGISLMREIVRKEGVGAMYNGYLATLLRNAPGSMLKFGIYEQIKKFISTWQEKPLTPTQHFAAGMTAGCLSSVFTTPLDVVKTRMMTGQIKASFPITAAINLARQEGMGALWSGFLPRLVWSATFFAVGMSTYELALAAVLKSWSFNNETPQQKNRKDVKGKVKGGSRPERVRLDPRAIPELIHRVYSDVNPHVLQTR